MPVYLHLTFAFQPAFEFERTVQSNFFSEWESVVIPFDVTD